MKKALLILIPILSFIGGALGGHFLREPDFALVGEEGIIATNPTAPDGLPPSSTTVRSSDPNSSSEPAVGSAWLAFPSQFFIPLMKGGQVSGTMILSLTIEMPENSQEYISEQEHRLRDALLRALMIHANTGGFEGNYTTESKMTRLRNTLLHSARQTSGDDITDILIQDIIRQ